MNWLRRYWQWLIPTIGILIVSVYLFATNNKPVDPSIPGGGLKPFFATILFIIAAYRTTEWIKKAFFILSVITFSVWFYPNIYPIIKTLGPIGDFINNIYKIISGIIETAYNTITFTGDGDAITALVIFIGLAVAAWIKKSKVLGVLALLLLLLLGWNSINAVYDRVSKSTASAAQGPGIIGNVTGYIGQNFAQTASELKERWVKKDSTFYDYNNGIFTQKNVSSEKEFIKVFLLSDSKSKDGLTFEKIRIGDPATGEEAWVYSGILLDAPKKKLASEKGRSNSISDSHQWKEIYNREVDFSQVEMEKASATMVVPRIPINANVSKKGNYRIKLVGYWDLYMSNELWTQFPWQGDDSQAGRPEFRFEKNMNFGAVVLYNKGENITPATNEGSTSMLSENSKLFIRLNIIMKPNEFFSQQIKKAVFRNSIHTPLKIIIEEEVEG